MDNKGKGIQDLLQGFFNKISSRIISYMSILLICSFLIVIVADFLPFQKRRGASSLPTINEIKNLPNESCYIEWLGNKEFDYDNRTMILVHGETPDNFDKKFSMSLNNTDYTFYIDNTSNYNIEIDIDINRKLYEYWLELDYNVGIFHYEQFADDNMEKLAKKLFNSVDMRFKTENGYINSRIPNYSLTEILAITFLSEMPKADYNEEIRLIGNGIGANLALSLSDYLYSYYEKGEISSVALPSRVSLIDPYLSNESFENNIQWRDFGEAKSMLALAENMLDYTTDLGLVAEIVENVEVSTVNEGDKPVTKMVSPYDYKLYDEVDKLSKSIKNNVAYLLLRQQYSWDRFFTDNYRQQNRAGLDWYLYSIHGSDDTSVGYEKTKPDYKDVNCNWGKGNTRPMLNHRVLNNTSTAGKNYSVSAWTETVWIRALKGIEFRMKKDDSTIKDDDGKVVTNIHGQNVHKFMDHNLTRFRSETYQLAMNMDRTILAGYVWNDENEDKIMNDGKNSHLVGIEVRMKATVNLGELGEKVVVDETTFTGKDGFYIVRLNNSFKTTINITVTVIPPSSKYHVQKKADAMYHIAELSRHTFEKNTKQINISASYGNAITIANCGMVVK